MRVLWLSTTPGLYDSKGSGYNGIGWISSVQSLIQTESGIELALSFLTSKLEDKEEIISGTHYYPIYTKAPNVFDKLRTYYGGYKKIDDNAYVSQIQEIITDFKPDIIQLFGMENGMATILGKTDVPIVVHLQGLLAPYDNAFFPIDFNKTNFIWPFTISEWLIRNGYIYAKNSIHVRGERERILFKRVDYLMGRTDWDFEVSQLLAPQSRYFHVDEVMRSCFYEHAGDWSVKHRDKFIITSTISQTIYKGLDLIIKAASLLEHETNLNFEWQVVGVASESSYTRFFEKTISLKSSKVRYMGVLNAEQLCDTLLDSDVYVHPSYIDNSPNSVCEAQLLGMPVIATGVGGITSLIEHKITGLIVPANAPYELAYWIKYLIGDTGMAENLAQNATSVALKRHDRKEIVKQLLLVYSTILEKNR